jgi:hypothetical protein
MSPLGLADGVLEGSNRVAKKRLLLRRRGARWRFLHDLSRGEREAASLLHTRRFSRIQAQQYLTIPS